MRVRVWFPKSTLKKKKKWARETVSFRPVRELVSKNKTDDCRGTTPKVVLCHRQRQTDTDRHRERETKRWRKV